MNSYEYKALQRSILTTPLAQALHGDPNTRLRYENSKRQAEKQASLASDANASKFWTPDEKNKALNAPNLVDMSFAASAVNNWRNAADEFLGRPKPLKEQWDEYLKEKRVLPGPNDIPGWRVPPDLNQQEENFNQQEENLKRKMQAAWSS